MQNTQNDMPYHFHHLSTSCEDLCVFFLPSANHMKVTRLLNILLARQIKRKAGSLTLQPSQALTP